MTEFRGPSNSPNTCTEIAENKAKFSNLLSPEIRHDAEQAGNAVQTCDDSRAAKCPTENPAPGGGADVVADGSRHVAADGAAQDHVPRRRKSTLTPRADRLFAALAGWDDLLREFRLANSLSAGAKQVRQNQRVAMDYLAAMNITTAAAITQESVVAYLARRQAAGATAKTLLNLRGSLSRWCEFLRGRKIMADNPAALVACARPEETAPPVIAPWQLDALFADARAMGPYMAAAVALGVMAGLRLGEICRLAWCDVDYPQRVLIVRRAKSKRPRCVSICEALGKYLTELQKLTGGTPWCFPARLTFRGGFRWTDRAVSPQTMARNFIPLQARWPQFRMLAGRRVGRAWHLLRHTFATNLLRARVDKHLVQDWLGHSDVRLTDRYIHVARAYDPAIENVYHVKKG